MFLHTNFVPKMNLQLPFSMEAYTRHVMAAAACMLPDGHRHASDKHTVEKCVSVKGNQLQGGAALDTA